MPFEQFRQGVRAEDRTGRSHLVRDADAVPLSEVPGVTVDRVRQPYRTTREQATYNDRGRRGNRCLTEHILIPAFPTRRRSGFGETRLVRRLEVSLLSGGHLSLSLPVSSKKRLAGTCCVRPCFLLETPLHFHLLSLKRTLLKRPPPP